MGNEFQNRLFHQEKINTLGEPRVKRQENINEEHHKDKRSEIIIKDEVIEIIDESFELKKKSKKIKEKISSLCQKKIYKNKQK